MIRRRDPDGAYRNAPCCVVAVGTARGEFPPAPTGIRADGYLSLAGMDAYCRKTLDVARKVVYPRASRPTLKEFLETNDRKAVVCVLGHFIYADRNTYWSFLRNAKDPVVAVWFLK